MNTVKHAVIKVVLQVIVNTTSLYARGLLEAQSVMMVWLIKEAVLLYSQIAF